ncbi:formylglycine-generating enzyme family protein, partial [Candidatus Latescibacterota bacterium]
SSRSDSMCVVRLTIIFCILAGLVSCSEKIPTITGNTDEGEGIVEINCIFPDEGAAKSAGDEMPTTSAYVYGYFGDGTYQFKKEMTFLNNTASLQISLQAGIIRKFKVVGYDGYQNITYQGTSQSIQIPAYQTVQAYIPMKKCGFVSIPAGSFVMGADDGLENERPAHTVTLDAFLMSSTEVTIHQWNAFMASGTIDGKNYEIAYPDTMQSFIKLDDSRPAYGIFWEIAVMFCNRLSDLQGLERCYDFTSMEFDLTKNGYRLPTEAEWEYACRAGTDTEYNTGDTVADLDRAGWYKDNSDEHEWPVGMKEPNAWGLYDMHGNMKEFCCENYNNDYSGTSPESNPNYTIETRESYVTRGGGFRSLSEKCNTRSRGKTEYYLTAGFRIVRRP